MAWASRTSMKATVIYVLWVHLLDWPACSAGTSLFRSNWMIMKRKKEEIPNMLSSAYMKNGKIFQYILHRNAAGGGWNWLNIEFKLFAYFFYIWLPYLIFYIKSLSFLHLLLLIMFHLCAFLLHYIYKTYLLRKVCWYNSRVF